MIDFLEFLLKKIVDHPEGIKIEEKKLGEGFSQFIIYGHKEDMGKIIGREGKVIQAIRNLAKIVAIKENMQVRIEIAEGN